MLSFPKRANGALWLADGVKPEPEDGEMTMSGRPGIVYDYEVVDQQTVEISPQANKSNKAPKGKMIITTDNADAMTLRLAFGSSPERALKLKRTTEERRQKQQSDDR